MKSLQEPVQTHYTTWDPHVAAVLVTLGFRVRRVDYKRSRGSEQEGTWTFTFTMRQDILTMVEKYWRNELQIDAFALMMSYNEVRRMMQHAVRERGKYIALSNAPEPPATCVSKWLRVRPEDNDFIIPRTNIGSLKRVYETLYHTLPWPKRIPKPDEVILQWNRRVTEVNGSCNWKQRIIEISGIYWDERLQQELKDLMAHQMAHFIWPQHPKALTDFLVGAGVSKEYTRARHPVSPDYLTVMAEQCPRYLLRCPVCRYMLWTHGPVVMSCPRCAPKRYTPQFHLVQYVRSRVPTDKPVA